MLGHECPGASGGGMSEQWPPAGLGALSAAVPALDLLKEATITIITSTTVSSQAKQKGGNRAPLINRKTGLKIY